MDYSLGQTGAMTALSTLGKGAVTITFSGIFIYTAELFHTPVRHLAVGTSSMMARVSSMAAPFVGQPLVGVAVMHCLMVMLAF